MTQFRNIWVVKKGETNKCNLMDTAQLQSGRESLAQYYEKQGFLKEKKGRLRGVKDFS